MDVCTTRPICFVLRFPACLSPPEMRKILLLLFPGLYSMQFVVVCTTRFLKMESFKIAVFALFSDSGMQ